MDLIEQADQPRFEYIPRSKRHSQSLAKIAAMVQPDDPFIRHIPLTRGMYAIVDAHLYDWLIQWNWVADRSGRDTWYAYATEPIGKGRRRRIRMHRLIVGLGDPSIDPRMVDHESRNGLDNRGRNLRLSGSGENAFNRSLGISNRSGYKGVSNSSHSNSWVAQITYKGVIYRSRNFPHNKLEDAARARDQMAYLLHGRFAVLNFPDEIPPPPEYQWASTAIKPKKPTPLQPLPGPLRESPPGVTCPSRKAC